MNFFEKNSTVWHILGWLIFIFLPLTFFYLTDNFELESFKSYLPNRIISSLCLILVFYLNLKILTPNILKKKQVVLSLGILLLSMGVHIIIERLLPHSIKPPMARPLPDLMQPSLTYMRPPRPPDRANLPRLLGSILSFSLVIGISSGMAMQRDRLRQAEEKQQMVLEKMAAELSVLKLQISPHFLFNTLNNIRWLARKKSDNTEDAIVKLSQLLRYILYQAHNDKVPLEQEINHLKNFIELQKMRLTNPNCISFTYNGAIQERTIEPLLFIPFVENAFKYGLHGQIPSEIIFKIEVKEKTIIFESKNTIFNEILPKPTDDSGIGIVNVQKRLALHYPNRHELRLDTEGGIFHVFLKLIS